MTQSFQRAGYTIIELLFYGAMLAWVMVFVVSAVVQLTGALAGTRAEEQLQATAHGALERIIREVRTAKSVSVSDGGRRIDLKVPVSETFGEMVQSDGAVAHWNFSEATGPLVDRIGSNDGTINDDQDIGFQSLAQLDNGGYWFSNWLDKNTRVELPDRAFDTHDRGAVEIILKHPDTTSSWDSIFSFNANGSSARERINLTFNIDGDPTILKTRGGPGNYVYCAVAVGVGDDIGDGFAHIVFAVDEDNSYIYVNGQRRDLNQVSGIPCPGIGAEGKSYWFEQQSGYADKDGRYWIGDTDYDNQESAPNSPGLNFYGIIDEVAVYNKALGADVWTRHYGAAFAPGSSYDIAKSIYLNSGDGAMYLEQDGSPEALTPSSVVITGTTFTEYSAGGSKSVRIEVSASATVGKETRTITVFGDATLRGAYVGR